LVYVESDWNWYFLLTIMVTVIVLEMWNKSTNIYKNSMTLILCFYWCCFQRHHLKAFGPPPRQFLCSIYITKSYIVWFLTFGTAVIVHIIFLHLPECVMVISLFFGHTEIYFNIWYLYITLIQYMNLLYLPWPFLYQFGHSKNYFGHCAKCM